MINRNSYQLTTTSSLLRARLAAVVSAVCVGRTQHGTMLFKQLVWLSNLTCWVKGQDVELQDSLCNTPRGHGVCCSDESF